MKHTQAYIAIILVCLLMAAMTGCSQTDLTLPDGTHLRRTHFFHDEQIGPVSYDAKDGSFTMDGYVGKSELPHVSITATGIEIGEVGK